MTTPNIGNELNRIVWAARSTMFNQGELAQLTYGAFDIAAQSIHDSDNEVVDITFPVGYRADRTPALSTRQYRKEELIRTYQHLAFHQLSVNGLVQLVVTVEAMLGDVVRAVVMRYPQKLSGKRTLPIQSVLEAASIQELHLRATDTLLNELTYKSPAEFAEAIEPLISINLRECPAFHRYAEVKASRDIYIHNRGVANDIYVRKAASHARVKSGVQLPADIQYFLESYEACLQLSEWLEQKLHDHWHSSELEDRNTPQQAFALKPPEADDTPQPAE